MPGLEWRRRRCALALVAAASQRAMAGMPTSSMRLETARSLPNVTAGLELGQPGDAAEEDHGEHDVERAAVLAQVGAGDDEEDGDPQVDAAVEVGVAVAQQVGVVVGDLEVVGGALPAEGVEAAEGDVDGDEGADGAERDERDSEHLRVGGRWAGWAWSVVVIAFSLISCSLIARYMENSNESRCFVSR